MFIPRAVYSFSCLWRASVMKDSDMLVSYRYDVESRLTSADLFVAPVSAMTWDADGNRVSFTSSTGGTWSFVYDTSAGIPAVVEEVGTGGSVYYVREPEGSLVARIVGESTSYYHFDALGSTRLLTSADGEVTDTYSYDAWGTLLGHDGNTQQPYQFVGELGYYSHWQDGNLFSESGWQLLQLGVRAYCPEIARFTQLDRIRSGANWYEYAGNRPATFVDPLGLRPADPNNPCNADGNKFDPLDCLTLRYEECMKKCPSRLRHPWVYAACAKRCDLIDKVCRSYFTSKQFGLPSEQTLTRLVDCCWSVLNAITQKPSLENIADMSEKCDKLDPDCGQQ